MTIQTQPEKNRLKLAMLKVLACLMLAFAFTNLFAQNAYELKKDHFYKAFKKTEIHQGASLLHAPVMIDEKMSTEFFYQGREEVLQPLITAMDHYLDSLDWSLSLPFILPKKGAPYLFVGSSETETAPPATMMMKDEHDKYPPMAMYLKKPSKDWKKSYTKAVADNQGDYAILIWLGLTEYPKANKGVFKKKVVLGTNYEREIRFLSAEDKPVEVLQLTSVILDKDGNIVRAGAEGFLYEDSPFWVQVIEVKTTVDDNAIQKLMNEERREDLPGHPLAWKVALYNLVEQLTQRPKNS